MAIAKVKMKWTGWAGAPGYSNFYFGWENLGDPSADESNTMFARVDQFAIDILGLLPPAVKLQVLGEIDLINPLDGKMSGAVARDAGVVRSGTGVNGSYSAAAGAVINWRTGVVIAGRRLRGRTFIVPLTSQSFTVDGGLSAPSQGVLKTAADKIFADHATIRSIVWARPADQRINKKGEVIPARTGDVGEITSASVPPLAAVLRSRRD